MTNPAILTAIQEHIALAQGFATQHAPMIGDIAEIASQALKKGHRIYFCGNGGSAADSQHLAAELVGRFKRERKSLPAVALSTDTSILTAIGNDYGYEHVFERQVESFVQSGDVLFALSTSGNSKNVILAVQKANQQGATTIGLLGYQGGKLKNECKHAITVPSEDTARIQEMHIMIGHIVCDLVERSFT